MPQWLGIALSIASFICGAAATWLLLRIRFERFEAMDTRREADWKIWREGVDAKLRALNGALLERVARMERDVGTHESGLRGAVHEMANRTTEHGMRISMLERKIT